MRESDKIIGPTEIDDPEYTSDRALWRDANKDAPGHVVYTPPEQVRGTTHGDYTHMSGVIQKIKDTMRSGESWGRLSASQREALELTATKVGRIVCGDPNHHDHWDDIAGYARLARNRIPHAKD